MAKGGTTVAVRRRHPRRSVARGSLGFLDDDPNTPAAEGPSGAQVGHPVSNRGEGQPERAPVAPIANPAVATVTSALPLRPSIRSSKAVPELVRGMYEPGTSEEVESEKNGSEKDGSKKD
ncbi:hypothetical protein E4U59_005871 [Claviceps monticola]|nr:hypothetical protein E4U59_005871 [Claviceps monticola]